MEWLVGKISFQPLEVKEHLFNVERLETSNKGR
jgi:hypothetical protein